MVKSYFYEIIAVKETKASSIGAWRKLGMAWVGWCKPPLGWRKLNTDGSFLADIGIVGGGGLVRDDKASWQGGFSIQMQCTSVEVIESWALLYGLKMPWEMGIRKLIVEIDSFRSIIG